MRLNQLANDFVNVIADFPAIFLPPCQRNYHLAGFQLKHPGRRPNKPQVQRQ